MAETFKLEFADGVKRPSAQSITCKRQRVIDGLSKQLSEIARFSAGHWSPRMWFWTDESGRFYLELRYAKKPLPISEDKSAIICKSIDDVADKIEQLKLMVSAGKLDQQIEAASSAIRSRFKTSK